MRRLLAAALVALAVPAVIAQPGAARLFVFATDGNGAAVTDLSAADFDVKEDGASRRILRAGHGNEPMRIVVLVDNSGAIDVDSLRRGLRQFVAGIPDSAEVGLVTVAGGYSLRVAPTLDRKRLVASVGSLYTDAGSTAVAKSLLDADSKLFRDAAGRWPVFVIVASDVAENTGIVKQIEFDAFTDRLQKIAATVHAVLVPLAGNSGGAKTLDAMAKNLTQKTGGFYAEANGDRALTSALGSVADRIAEDERRMAAGYEIEYVGGSSRADVALEVGTAREGVTLRPSFRRVP